MTTYGDSLRPSPLEELREWLGEVELVTGTRPTMLRLGPKAWKEVCTDADVIERMGLIVSALGGTEDPAPFNVAELLELETIELVYPILPPGDSGGVMKR